MARLKKTTKYGMNAVEINGRFHYLDNIKEIKPSFYDGMKLNSEWIVCLGDESTKQYRVHGYRDQWYVCCDDQANWEPLRFKSLTGCLKSLNSLY